MPSLYATPTPTPTPTLERCTGRLVTYYKSDYAGAGYLSLPAMEAGLVDPHDTMFKLPGFGDAHRKTLVFNRSPVSGEAGWFATAYAEDFARSRAIQTSTTLHTYGYDERDIFGARGGVLSPC